MSLQKAEDIIVAEPGLFAPDVKSQKALYFTDRRTILHF